MAPATSICRFEDEKGCVLWGQPCAVDSVGLPTKAQLLAKQDPYGDLELAEEQATVVKLLAPVEPRAIICIGLNYQKHAAESKMPVPKFPVVFHKSVSTLQHPLGPIELPKIEPKVDWEVELAVVIGKKCKDASADSALEYVAGYTASNDVSGRLWQLENGGGQWCFGKSFDTFTPLGPVLATPTAIPDPQVLQIRSDIDGQIMQESNTSDMIFSVAKIIAFLSQDTTLLPGTVILTGTPFGVGLGLNPQRWLKAGETVTVEVEGIGKLSNPVISAKEDQARIDILPDDTIEWMWGDVNRLAHINPLRWSGAKTPMETIAVLEQCKEEDQKRPVEVIVNRAGKKIKEARFETVADAKCALRSQAQS